MKTIIIYSTKNCKYCKDAKEYFDSIGASYAVVDVGEDKENREKMVELTGQRGVPVIVIGTTIIIGFDKKKIDEAIGECNALIGMDSASDNTKGE